MPIIGVYPSYRYRYHLPHPLLYNNYPIQYGMGVPYPLVHHTPIATPVPVPVAVNNPVPVGVPMGVPASAPVGIGMGGGYTHGHGYGMNAPPTAPLAINYQVSLLPFST
jgi:hypothetical protein